MSDVHIQILFTGAIICCCCCYLFLLVGRFIFNFFLLFNKLIASEKKTCLRIEPLKMLYYCCCCCFFMYIMYFAMCVCMIWCLCGYKLNVKLLSLFCSRINCTMPTVSLCRTWNFVVSRLTFHIIQRYGFFSFFSYVPLSISISVFILPMIFKQFTKIHDWMLWYWMHIIFVRGKRTRKISQWNWVRRKSQHEIEWDEEWNGNKPRHKPCTIPATAKPI